jgi:hypothetical protein
MARSSSSRERMNGALVGLAVGLVLTAMATPPKPVPEVNIKLERNGTELHLSCQVLDQQGVQYK